MAPTQPTESPRVPLKAVVLAGGKSTRLGKDKALLTVGGQSLVEAAVERFHRLNIPVYVSVNAEQARSPHFASFTLIVDQSSECGPIEGISLAHELDPHSAWFVLSVDRPGLELSTIETLVRLRSEKSAEGWDAWAFGFQKSHKSFEPDPLCTIWEPSALSTLEEFKHSGELSPRFILRQTQVYLAPSSDDLDDVDTLEDWQAYLEKSRI